MKPYTKHLIGVAIFCGMTAIFPAFAKAQKFALKPYADIGVGSAMSIKSDIPFKSKSSSNTSFGLDFGYSFWKKGGNSLEVNIGLGYSITNIKLGVGELDFSYNAPASADEDGNPYVRYYNLSGMEQKLNLGYLNLPIYLTYGYQFSHRIAVNADLGLRFGFKSSARMKSLSGTAKSYGVYPEYDDLVIDAPWLNGFGETDLSEAKHGKIEVNSFYASLFLGAAFDVYLGGPVWLNLGVRYDCGFNNLLKKVYENGSYTSETAPVTYTVSEGQQVKPLSGYLTSSKLSPFSIHAGLIFKF